MFEMDFEGNTIIPDGASILEILEWLVKEGNHSSLKEMLQEFLDLEC